MLAHVGILGLLDLKILKAPNYLMFKDKLIPNIKNVVGNSFMHHTIATKMKHEHIKCNKIGDIIMAWSCKHEVQY